VKIIALNQQDANDLLGLITSDGLAIKASAAARVHQLQALLSNAPVDMVPVCAVCGEFGKHAPDCESVRPL
jgi:hypothetical protein